LGRIRALLDIIVSIMVLTLVGLAFLPYIGYIFLKAKWMRWRALRVVRAELRKAGFSKEVIKELENVVIPPAPGLGGVLRWLTSRK